MHDDLGEAGFVSIQRATPGLPVARSNQIR